MKKILKQLYKLVPFKKEFYSFLKLFWKPKQSVYQHLYFTGNFKVKVDKSTSFKIRHYGFQVENDIFWAGLTGQWEKNSLELWIKLCKRASTIMDIGANTGVYSLIAKSVNPNSIVYAFEPVTRVCNKLKGNIKLNSFDVACIEKAVSNNDGEATIYDLDTEHVYSVTVNKNLSASNTKVIETKIKTVALDSFIQENNISNIDLMKIDVETHEPEVLEGFQKYLSVFRPAILIEILTDEVGKKVNDITKGLGYLYFNIDEKGGIRQANTITKSDYYNYLLCSEKIASELGILKSAVVDIPQNI